MTVQKVIEFLSTLPQDLDLHMIQADSGGCDCEIVPLTKLAIYKFRDGEHYMADVSSQTKDEKVY